ncbi:MAG: hypothetical protein HOW73_19295 [Polyangiaceae bacterium]|nr:hypothetical protein [Polyangiaceae bacterium]
MTALVRALSLIAFGSSAGCVLLDGTLFETADGGNAADGGNGGQTTAGGADQGGGGANGGSGGEGASTPGPEWLVGADVLDVPVRFLDIDVSDEQIIVAGIAQGTTGGSGKFSLGGACANVAAPEGFTPFVAFYDDNGACQRVVIIDDAHDGSRPRSVSVTRGLDTDSAFIGVTHENRSKIYQIMTGGLFGDAIDFGPNAAVNDLALGEEGLLVAGWKLEGNAQPCEWNFVDGATRASMLLKFNPTDLECQGLVAALNINVEEVNDELIHVSAAGANNIYTTGFVANGATVSPPSPCVDCVFAGPLGQPYVIQNLLPEPDCAYPPVVVGSGEAWTTQVPCNGVGDVHLVDMTSGNASSALDTAGARAYSMALTSTFAYGAGEADLLRDAGANTYGFVARASTDVLQPAQGFFLYRMPEAGFAAQSEIRGVAARGNAIVIAGTYSGETACDTCDDVMVSLNGPDGWPVVEGNVVGCAGPLCGPFLALWQPGPLDNP